MKKVNYLGVSAGVLLSVLTQGCDVVNSSQVSPTTVYAGYSARYNEQNGSANYSAHFSVGGSTGTVLELDGASTVEIDGSSMSMQRDIFNDLTYVNTVQISAQDYQRGHEFFFRDQSGNIFRNDFSFPTLVEVAGGPSVESLGGFSVAWVAGGPMDLDDSVTAVLTRSDGVTAQSYAAPGASQNGTLTFFADDLQRLGASQVQLTICHAHALGIQGDASGGYMNVSSCSRATSLTLQ